MSETIWLRLLSILAALLGCRAAWSAVDGAARGESDFRLVARITFAATFAWLAWLAWRRPRDRAGRIRRRVLRLLAVLASRDAQHEWEESTPSTDLAEALLSDWRRATASADDLALAFRPEELGVVLAVRADVARLEGALPHGPGAADSPEWEAILARAAAAQRTFLA